MRMEVSECLYSDGLKHFRKAYVDAGVCGMHGVGVDSTIEWTRFYAGLHRPVG